MFARPGIRASGFPVLRERSAASTLTRDVRPLTRPGLVLAIAVAVVALPTVASGALSATAAPTLAATNSTSYQDSSGENPAAPDITTIDRLEHRRGRDLLQDQHPEPAAVDAGHAGPLDVDTDANPATGDPEPLGADYVIQLFRGEVALFRWDGSDYTRRAATLQRRR